MFSARDRRVGGERPLEEPDGALDALFQRHPGLPAELRAGERDVGLPGLRVVLGQRPEDDRARAERALPAPPACRALLAPLRPPALDDAAAGLGELADRHLVRGADVYRRRAGPQRPAG